MAGALIKVCMQQTLDWVMLGIIFIEAQMRYPSTRGGFLGPRLVSVWAYVPAQVYHSFRSYM